MSTKRDRTAYILEARQAIRDTFATLPIFKRSREQAIYHYCAVLDDKAGTDQVSYFSAGRAAVESSTRAIPALFSSCSPGKSAPRFEKVVFSEAHELFTFSRAYENVEYCFELANKGQFKIHVAKRDPRITFVYADAISDATDTLRRSGELLERSGLSQSSSRLSPDPHDVLAEVRAALEGIIQFRSSDYVAYEYTPELSAGVSRLARLIEGAIVWEIPPDLKLGTLSLGDFRRYWSAAGAIARTHELAHLIACRGDARKWPTGSRVDLRSRTQWIHLLSKISGLSPESTATILAWLTFDPAISAKTPMLQPFLEIAPGQLCVPYLFLATNNIERNLLKLLNRHPAMMRYADGVRASKEPLALAQLSERFPAPAFQTKSQVLLANTDADLLIYEIETGWALVLQHKWLIGPDTATESAANDQELGKGVRQAVLARDYLLDHPDRLRTALSLPKDAAVTNIEACVVCRGADPTGFLANPAVPVLTEKALVDFVNRDCKLPKLWNLLNARPDLNEAAGQFDDVQCTVSLVGYEFVIPVLVG